jgi:hypothetical protein
VLDILLFALDVDYAAAAVRAGVAAVVVDWEWRGKAARQDGRDTQINYGTQEDLMRARASCAGPVICRINNRPEVRQREARLAVELGADEVWLPMVRSVAEVRECLDAVGDRAAVGMMLETREALALGRELTQLPLSHVYVGLNDLCIDLKKANLFEPLVDGTLERFRDSYPGRLGFAGVTRPERGAPIPQRLLLAEMARLDCSFGVARRAFHADVAKDEIGQALADIAATWRSLGARTAHARDADHAQLERAVMGVPAVALS